MTSPAVSLVDPSVAGSILFEPPPAVPALRVGLRRVLVFTVAGRTRCADVDQVREIVPITPATRLPGAPAHVRGIINLRGTLVTVLDAALRLHGVPSSGPDVSILLVERAGGAIAGVIVDNVFDIQAVPAAEVDGGALLDLRELTDTALAGGETE